ncbi:nuclear transport factor 2 family protein [Actinoplanes sp. Pm04-4]|uniref:Nuclear transport factor 2 family protein n=1 Tax=Paractinoplanes pyxinae TaxID=2997416 RepID=A0ABT4BAW3_9ACTN|nr:nuclear transport factor 2 family protein [Actinoplanes pyxinae]MCY1143664.1 nuclear transport factor 2 family protein [Actinoplanes pyxinae]
MIARVWRGVVRADAVAAYARYVDETGVAEYARTPGNRSAQVFTRDLGDGTAEILALSTWTGWDALRRFTGDDVDAMVLYPEDEKYLVEPPQLNHYDVRSHPGVAREVAEAFSAHRFADAYPFLSSDVTWVVRGGETRQGSDAVRAVCEQTLADLVGTRTDFLKFDTIADGDRAAVDTLARYTDPDGGVTVVASCDLYEFRDGALATITSYYAECPDD